MEVKKGNTLTALNMLTEEPGLIGAYDHFEKTALHWAV